MTAARLVDEIQLVVMPTVFGRGKTLFAMVNGVLHMELTSARAFKNGNVVICYTPKG